MARTGSAYCGIGTGLMNDTADNRREYFGCFLNDSLLPGKKYFVEFYVSLSDSSMWAIDKIGAYFSDTMIQDLSNFSFLPFIPQIESPTGFTLSDTTNWVRISDTLFASGGEKYLTIGFFHPNTDESIDSLNGTWYTSYYYIDDVSVVDCGYVGVQDFNDELKISLTPNPGNGEFSFRGIFPSSSSIKFYDLLGNELKEIEVPSGNQGIPISLPFAEGVYLYQVISEQNILRSGKLVIQK